MVWLLSSWLLTFSDIYLTVLSKGEAGERFFGLYLLIKIKCGFFSMSVRAC